MRPTKIIAVFFIFLFCCSGGIFSQDVLLLTEDFETGGASFTLNTAGPGSNTGDNQWIINNQYTGTPTYPNTTTQNITNGGTIGFAPQSHYLHIHDLPSGITNANYDASASSDRFAEMAFGICTYGMEEVHFSFFYLCEGSAGAYGTVHYSLDGGPWIQLGGAYSNTTNWQYTDLTDPAFSNVGSLRFGFRWQNDNGSPPSTEAFAVDDINIVGSYSETDPVTINVISVSPNPVCQGSFVTFEYELSDTLCDGNYQIELSNSAGNFPSPFGTWVMPINYPTTTGFTSIQIPSSAAVGDCYRIRISRMSPPPAITGIASACFSIIECPNVITTLQPVVTLDTNAVCVHSAIDIPFTSTGVYSANAYIAQLSNADGTFPPSPTVVGTFNNSNTYDPLLGQLPGSVSGQVPVVAPGCNYYLRVISTNPDAIGSVWGPFCIQQCDLATNNYEDLNFCVSDCVTDPNGESEVITVGANTYNSIADYLPGNVFTTQLLSSMDFSQIGSTGILGSVAATDDASLTVHVPCKDSLPIYGIPLGMNYMRVIATNSTDPENDLGSLIRVTVGAYSNEPQLISSYEYPSFLPKDVFCIGETAVLMFAPYNYFDNSTFMWSCSGINGGAPFVSPSGANSNILYVTLGGAGELTFSIQETNYGCVSPWTPEATITVLGSPNANITGPLNVCEGDTTAFQVPFYPNTYYSWTLTADESSIAYQDTSNNEMNIAFSQPGNYNMSVNILNLCGSDSDVNSVHVLEAPDVGAGNDTTICIGESVSISTPTGGGYTYAWSNGTSNISTANSVTVSPVNSTSYFITTTSPQGCPSKDTIFVEVLFPDAPTLRYDSICPGGLNQTDIEADIDGLYEWETGSTNDFITVHDTGVYSLSITVDGAICPVLVDYHIIPLQPDVAVQYTDSICPGGKNELLLTAHETGTYLWNNGSITSSIVVDDTGVFTVGVYNIGEVCPLVEEYHVLPMISQDLPVFFTDSVCPGGNAPITLVSDAPGSYEWSTGSTASQITVNDTGFYVLNVYLPQVPCPRTLMFTVKPDTCYSQPEVFFYVPNTLTANADGLNDVFAPVFSDTQFIEEYRMRIYDRWGVMVFETVDIKQPWTGGFRDGEYFVTDDIYIWRIEYKEMNIVDQRKHTGHLIIVR